MTLNDKELYPQDTSKKSRAIEALLEILLRLAGVYITYLAFNWIGNKFINSDFSSETLFSLLMLPALYILKSSHSVLEPFFVSVKISSTEVEATTGILTQRLDKLNLKTVENIEVVTTLGGRLFNYSSIHLYAHGSWVCLPFLKRPTEIKKELEDFIEIAKRGNRKI